MRWVSRSRRSRGPAIAVVVGALGLLLPGCTVRADVVSYEDLPAEEARYTLELDNGDAVTVWEYDSAQVGEPTNVQPCAGEYLGETAGECRPEPLIFLRYEFGLDLHETVPANRPHRITVTGYYEHQLTTPPEVVDLSVEVSYDGGESWRSVGAEATEKNTFALTVRHPRGAGTVSLRVSASDSDGNTVVQTLPEAFAVGTATDSQSD